MSAQTRTILERFWATAPSQPESVALRHRVGGAWRSVTWGEYADAVIEAARGLIALGFAPSDRMSLLSGNRPEWFIADLACMSIGGTTAPIYATSSAQQVGHMVGHSGSRIAVVEDGAQLDKVLSQRVRLPRLERIVVLEGGARGPTDLVITWRELLERARATDIAVFEERRARVSPDDIASFVYTSGTSGTPKAVVLTHGNIWWTCKALERHLRIPEPRAQRALSYLPLSHIAERMVSHMMHITYGCETWFASSPQTLRDDLVDCRPTYFFGVPRVWEKFHDAVMTRLRDDSPGLRPRVERALLRRALHMGRRVAEAQQRAVTEGRLSSEARLPTSLRVRHALFERAVLAPARARAGLGSCERAFSAAAPIAEEIVWFFHAMGVPIAEGYGQSETNGPTTWNPHDAIRIGTVGTPLPGVRLRIAGDGEVLVKGGNVTPGYHADERSTADLFDDEGWMRSGDLGQIDERGYLRLTDRKKDIIVTSGGKNIAPQEIENRLKQEPLVGEVVVIGEARPYLTALVALDPDRAVEWARAEGLPAGLDALAGHDRVLDRIRSSVADVNAAFARVEGIKRFRVLGFTFSLEQDEITPTLKVKRSVIAQRYADVIDAMYARDAPDAAPARADAR